MERIKASVLLNGLAPDSMMFGEAEVSLVTTDSREVRPGCIFVATTSRPRRWKKGPSAWW